MAKLSHSIASILFTVVFLVLAAIATIIYSGDEAQKSEMEGNFLYRQTRAALDTVWGAVWSLGNINRASSTAAVDAGVASENEPNFWSRLIENIKEEWASGEAVKTDFNASDQGGLSWVETEKGGEIVFTTKTGQEHKLPLPFKFLNRKSE